MKKFKNKKTGRVIDWNPENGTLISSMWKEIKENQKEEIQVFDSLKEIERNAIPANLAKTKAGNTYKYNGKKWVKVNE